MSEVKKSSKGERVSEAEGKLLEGISDVEATVFKNKNFAFQ